MGRGRFERANALNRAIFKDLEVLSGEAVDGFAGLVGNDNIQHNQAHVDGKRRVMWVGGLRRGWSLIRVEGRRLRGEERSRNERASDGGQHDRASLEIPSNTGLNRGPQRQVRPLSPGGRNVRCDSRWQARRKQFKRMHRRCEADCLEVEAACNLQLTWRLQRCAIGIEIGSEKRIGDEVVGYATYRCRRRLYGLTGDSSARRPGRDGA